MDTTQIFTIALTLILVVGSNITMFLWSRSESRADQAEIRDLVRAIQQDVRDFHGRLCAIEERKTKNRNN